MGSLNLPQIAENQAAAYVTSNDADALLEKALCSAKTDLDASSGDIVLSDSDFRENWFFLVGGAPAGAFNLIVPALNKPFMVENNSGQTATVKTASGAAGQVLSGEVRFLYCDGLDMKSLTDLNGAGGALPTFSGVLVSLSSDTSVASSTNTAIDWAAEDYDEGGYFDLGSHASRLTIPVGVSKVVLSAQIRWDTNTTNDREVLFYKNGSGSYPGRGFLHVDATSKILMNLTSPPLSVTAGDYFELMAWQDSGVSRDIQAGNDSWFSIQAVG